jgi:GAF domain-containing protein
MSSFDAAGREQVATEQAFELFCQSRACAGLRGALACLAELSGYRRVALVRLEGTRLVAIAYVDRDKPDASAPEVWPDALIDACLLRDDEGRVREAGELHARLPGGSPVRCRCVPVIDREGELHASLCLFDDGPAPAADADDLSLLLQIAASLASDDEARRWCSDGATAAEASDAPWQSAAGEEDPGSALDEPAPADQRR